MSMLMLLFLNERNLTLVIVDFCFSTGI